MIRFRRTVPEDLLRIRQWIEQDHGHQGMDANFWMATGPGVSCYVVESERGPLIFVREEAQGEAVRLHLQFAPHDRRDVVSALREGYPLVAEDARGRGFRQVRFDSESPALMRVMIEMGFKAELVAEL